VRAATSRILAKNKTIEAVSSDYDTAVSTTNDASIANNLTVMMEIPQQKPRTNLRRKGTTGQQTTDDDNSSLAQLPDLPPKPGRGSKAVKDATATKIRDSIETPCPVCLEAPFHLRYRCPIIKAGPEAVKKRLHQLDATRDASLIKELETMVINETPKGQDHNVNANLPSSHQFLY
jgi:hypothetical protein